MLKTKAHISGVMAKQKWQLQENFPASKIWFSKLKVPIKCPARRTEKYLYCCGLHQQSRDKDAKRQCSRFLGFLKGKGFRNLHAGKATRRRMHSTLSVRASHPVTATSQTLLKDTQLQMICLWGESSLGLRRTDYILCVFMPFWPTETGDIPAC